MRFSTVAAALLPVGVALAQTTHVVKVGGGSLTYDPPSYVSHPNTLSYPAYLYFAQIDTSSEW